MRRASAKTVDCEGFDPPQCLGSGRGVLGPGQGPPRTRAEQDSGERLSQSIVNIGGDAASLGV